MSMDRIITQFIKGLNGNTQRKGEPALPACTGTPSWPCSQTLAPLVLQALEADGDLHHRLLWFLDLHVRAETTSGFLGLPPQGADLRTSQPPCSCEPILLINLLLYTCTLDPIGHVSAETNTVTFKNYGEIIFYNWTMKVSIGDHYKVLKPATKT